MRRLHIIDACQASDLPQSYKYERNLGSGEHLRNIREGVSFEVLFQRVEQTVNKAVARMTLLRWALFQFLIGNSDAHGKNFSFSVRREGLDPAPWYDLVSVAQYPGIDHELAMAWGDAFSLNEVAAFQLADFAQRGGQDKARASVTGNAALFLAIQAHFTTIPLQGTPSLFLGWSRDGPETAYLTEECKGVARQPRARSRVHRIESGLPPRGLRQVSRREQAGPLGLKNQG